MTRAHGASLFLRHTNEAMRHGGRVSWRKVGSRAREGQARGLAMRLTLGTWHLRPIQSWSTCASKLTFAREGGGLDTRSICTLRQRQKSGTQSHQHTARPAVPKFCGLRQRSTERVPGEKFPFGRHARALGPVHLAAPVRSPCGLTRRLPSIVEFDPYAWRPPFVGLTCPCWFKKANAHLCRLLVTEYFCLQPFHVPVAAFRGAQRFFSLRRPFIRIRGILAAGHAKPDVRTPGLREMEFTAVAQLKGFPNTNPPHIKGEIPLASQKWLDKPPDPTPSRESLCARNWLHILHSSARRQRCSWRITCRTGAPWALQLPAES